MTCKRTEENTTELNLRAAGVWVTCSGADSLQSVATRPLVVKSGTGAWQTPSAKRSEERRVGEDTGGVLSVTVKEEVQVDSLLAASMTCKVSVVTPRRTSV